MRARPYTAPEKASPLVETLAQSLNHSRPNLSPCSSSYARILSQSCWQAGQCSLRAAGSAQQDTKCCAQLFTREHELPHEYLAGAIAHADTAHRYIHSQCNAHEDHSRRTVRASQSVAVTFRAPAAVGDSSLMLCLSGSFKRSCSSLK